MTQFSGSRLLLLAVIVLSLFGASFAQVAISVSFGPPALPVYAQPVCPAAGYIWVPGYWAYDPNIGDYYWVPGTWVLAPELGLLWTPPWWGWENGAYLFHAGYWGPTVGFYGGINYGFGYFGHGYEGGRWNHGVFFYNRAVSNVNVTRITNVYNVRVTNVNVNRVSYNGGPGGIEARATAAEEAAARERHIGPVAAQTQHRDTARNDPQLRASANQGRPPIAATPQPASFKAGAVRATAAGAPYHPPVNRGPAGSNPKEQVPHPNQPAASIPHPPNNVPRPPTPVHARNVPAPSAPTPRNTGNPQADREYQQRLEELNAQHQKEHEQLYQKQEQDHERMSQKPASAAQIQQMERQHQQQTMQMEQRHNQEQQKAVHQAPSARNEPARPEPQRH
ncbi:MAG TPA: adenylate cyclase [Candidatus Binatia bacterium]|nr:adenylate cyclase [Candidatus Binatia bacterium]